MFEEQKNICTVCGHRHKLTAHHKIRRRDGGTGAAHNLVGICRPCHDHIDGVKGNRAGCTCPPNMVAAAAASAAHWNVVVDHWEAVMLNLYDHRETQQRSAMFLSNWDDGPSHFAGLLYEAWQEMDPRCT